MSLSNDLISQFVKATKDNTPTNQQAIVYGTAVELNNKMYVKIDGSDLLTPVISTTEIKSTERVSVVIKDHYAMVTGNISNPSVSTSTVDGVKDTVNDTAGKIADFELVIADKVSVGEFNAQIATINKAIIDKASIAELDAIKATIKDLDVDALNAELAKIQEAIIDVAHISDLTAINADIESLVASVAKINTLVGGNLTMDNIQSLILTSSKVTVDNAFIKDAMIDRVSASKLYAGTINTNNINIQSEDGSMVLKGSLQQFKDSEGNVRIQIGKDATGDFTFALYGADGQGQLINQNGITASAIADGLIVNNMVADNAAISGTKLDIHSIVTEINDNSTYLKSSIIYLDDKDQTLDVAFNEMVSTVETASNDLEQTIETLKQTSTSLQVANGKIESLISNTTIVKEDGKVVQLKDDYSNLKITVNEFSNKISSLETNYGKTLKSTKTQYYVSLSSLSLVGGSWSETTPQWTTGKYIWQRLLYIYSDNSEVEGTAVCIQGAKGEDGLQGPPGEDGTSVAIKGKVPSASDLDNIIAEIGEGYITEDDGHLHIFNGTDWDDVGLIRGPEGPQGPQGEQGVPGIQGPAGADGKPTYTWVKYADTPTSGMSDSPNNKKYIGLAYNKTTTTESSNYSDYAWSLIQGPQGEQGIPGPTGQNGETTYTWIKYADSPTSGMSDNPSGKKYMGIAYNKTTQTESSVYTDYSWSLIQGPQGIQGEKGDQGPQGIQGPAGADGKPTYTWVKYADTPTSGMSDVPSNKAYIGLAYNKNTATESTNYSDYAWSLIKGEKGDTGVQGPAGADGKPTYTWIKYADTPTTGMSDSPTGKKYMGIAYNKTTATESSNYSDYSWSLIQGEKGDTGAPGQNGVGIQNVVEYYQKSTSNTTAPTTWSTTPPTLDATNRYLWNYEIMTYTDNSTTSTPKKVIGVYGDKGNTGNTGATGNGISKVENWYLATASATGVTTSTSGFTTTVQNVTNTKKYLWNYEKIYYTNGSTSMTNPCIIGVYGEKGDTGAAGQSVTNYTPQFYAHNSSTSAPSSSVAWSDTCPAYTAGKFLWIRNKITLTNPTETKYTNPYYDASWDAKGTADEAKSTVSSKISEIDQTLDGFRTTVRATETKLNNLKVPNRNILRNSGNFIDTSYWLSNGGATPSVIEHDGYPCLTGNDSIKQDYQYELKPNTWYQFWAYIKFANDMPVNTRTPLHEWVTYNDPGSTITSELNAADFQLVSSSTIPANTWAIIHTKFLTRDAVDGKVIYFRPMLYSPNNLNEFWLRYIALEEAESTKYIWTPSAEQVVDDSMHISDEASKMEDENGEIVYIKDKLAETVTTVDGVTTTIKSIETYFDDDGMVTQMSKQMSQFEQLAGRFNMDFWNTFESNTEGIQELHDYITFSSDGILIGQTGYPVKLMLSKDRIKFIDTNGAQLAYFSEGKLFVENAEILSTIKIANYGFLPTAGGSLTIAAIK